MNNSFWTAGPKRLLLALKKRRNEVDNLILKSQLAKDPAEKAEIENQLRELLEEHAPTQDEIDRSLFFLR